MAQRRASYLILPPRSAAVAQAHGASVEAVTSNSSRSQTLFGCLKSKLSTAGSSLWAFWFGGSSSAISEQASEVLRRMDFDAGQFRQEHLEEEEIELPQKRAHSFDSEQPQKALKQESIRVTRAAGTQTLEDSTTQTDMPKAVMRKPRWDRYCTQDYKTIKELSLMRFAMRVPSLTTAELRKGAVEAEFSREYEATMPFYKTVQDFKETPQVPKAAEVRQPVVPPAIFEQPPMTIVQEEADSCATTPEQTPEKPVVQAPLLKLASQSSSDFVKDDAETSESNVAEEVSSKPFSCSEETKEPVTAAAPIRDIIFEKPLEPEIAHPSYAKPADPYAFTSLQSLKSFPDNPFLKPVQAAEPKLPFLFGSMSQKTSSPFLSSNLTIPTPKAPEPIPFNQPSVISPFAPAYSQQFTPQQAETETAAMEVDMVSSPNPFATVFPQPLTSTPTFGSLVNTPVPSVNFPVNPFNSAPMQPQSHVEGSFNMGNVPRAKYRVVKNSR